MNRPIGFILYVLLVTVVGCEQGEKLSFANVSGTVTYNGSPIEKGKITFAIEGRPPSTMDIVDGKYAGQAMVGSNKVSVSAKKKTAAAPKVKGGAAAAKGAETTLKGYMTKKKWEAAPGEYGGPPIDYDPTLVEYIPPEWGTQTKQIRVVESGAANKFEFEIKGK